MPKTLNENNFPFKPGKRLSQDEMIGFAQELTNALWMWNINKADAKTILELVIAGLPQQVWPNNIPLEPGEKVN